MIKISASIDEEWQMMGVGYMIIPVILFGGGILVSAALFTAGMKRVEEKQK